MRCLLTTALEMPSPRAPLRPLTLYTMVILGYCAGLRLGELTRLALADFRPDEGTLEVRNTKFFKSRRLPLTTSFLVRIRRSELRISFCHGQPPGLIPVRFPKMGRTGNFWSILAGKSGWEKQNGKEMPMPKLKREIWCHHSDVVGVAASLPLTLTPAGT